MSTDNLPKNKRMRPGVKALIVNEGKVLMIHENVMRNGKSIEITDFPGGGIDFAEPLKEALIREVKEEISLNIKINKVVGAWDFVLGEKGHCNPEKQGVHIVCIGYQCEVLGNIKIDTTNNPAAEDIFDARWYTREELLANKAKLLQGHIGMIEAVQALDIKEIFPN